MNALFLIPSVLNNVSFSLLVLLLCTSTSLFILSANAFVLPVRLLREHSSVITVARRQEQVVGVQVRSILRPIVRQTGRIRVGGRDGIQVAAQSRADEEASFLLPNQTNLKQDTSIPFAETLALRGVARVNNGLSESTAYELQKYIDETLESSLEEVNSYRIPQAFRFANVLEKSNRWDLLLTFDEDGNGQEQEQEDSSLAKSSVVMDAMSELLGEEGKVGQILEELLGKDAILYELACLISDPGSNRQEIHPDIVYQHDNTIPLIACFVSLQDIDSTMGPTVFIPDTITEEHHQAINNDELADEMLQNIPSNISTLNTGDCSLYNPMLLHAGGGNVSDRRRRLFYFTFLNSNDVKDPSCDFNPGSINPILKQRNLTLKQVREIIKKYKNKDKVALSY